MSVSAIPPQSNGDSPGGPLEVVAASHRGLDRAFATESETLAATVNAHRLRHTVARVVVATVIIGVFAWEIMWLAPHIVAAGDALTHPKWWWVGLALWVEVASMVNFARLQRTMLTAGGVKVPLRRAVAVAFASNAMSVSLPGGALISSGYTFRRMRSWGASSPLVAFGLVTSGFLSTVALGLIGILGATFAGDNPNLWTLGLELGAALAVVLGLRHVIRRPDLLLRFSHAGLVWSNRLRRRSLETGQDRVRELLEELILIKPRRRDWLRGIVFAAVNWIADMVCLIASCRAVGAHGPTIGVALVAYAAGMAASSVPLLPGGLGVVDGALILALNHGGLPIAEATAGVLLYRLISFLLVVAIGWATWLVIRRTDKHRVD